MDRRPLKTRAVEGQYLPPTNMMRIGTRLGGKVAIPDFMRTHATIGGDALDAALNSNPKNRFLSMGAPHSPHHHEK